VERIGSVSIDLPTRSIPSKSEALLILVLVTGSLVYVIHPLLGRCSR
jgi:hypothetical protein